MSKFRGIYIGGTGGCGVTLMGRLFHSFEETEVSKTADEKPRIDELASRIQTLVLNGHTIPVVRRTYGSLFCNKMEEAEVLRQLKVVDNNHIGIMVMLRDQEAATKSRKGHVSISDWAAAYSDAFLHWGHVQYLCNYYKLCSEPDLIQKEISEAFGLEIKHKFSDYPDFLPEFYFKKKYVPGHAPRRIGAPYDA